MTLATCVRRLNSGWKRIGVLDHADVLAFSTVVTSSEVALMAGD